MVTGDPLRGGAPQAPACRCGKELQPKTTRFGEDDGTCARHPERGTDAWKSRTKGKRFV